MIGSLLTGGAPDNPYLTPPAWAFYSAVVLAVIASIVSPFVQRKIEVARDDAARKAAAEEAAAKAADEAAAEQAAAKAGEADDAIESARWLRGQVTKLQESVDAEAQANRELHAQASARDRTIDGLRASLARCQERTRQCVEDIRVRDRRIAQLEGVYAAAGMTLPPPESDYRALLDRDARARRPREEP